MIAAAQIRDCRDPLSLLRLLGYPVAPLPIASREWRAAGIDLGWNGNSSFQLAVRLPRFDLFVLTGGGDAGSIRRFLLSYGAWNEVTKSLLVTGAGGCVSFYDLDRAKKLRRLDVDLAAPSPHAVDRLNLLALGGDDAPSLLPRIVDRALDRESVTRRFFERFRAAVSDVAAALDCPEESPEAIAAEALLILSRLLFLSFVQEKGWLNGERRFLVDRCARAIGQRREFFADVLLPLFFGCLNTPRRERTPAAGRLGRRIPYLNGGLFEPSPFELRNVELHLPNELLQRVLEELFERFDFRIDEQDDAGTHVDPEMLGKVFESLMAEDERAASGSFYTPREIVDVLTTQAIVEWASGGDATLREALVQPERRMRPAAARVVLDRLARINVLDPACGSGAFLLSALGVLERLTVTLSRIAGVAVPADLRRRIVERSLYGVDLKPEAVRLCELRLWLALVSGSDATIEEIAPLPNLDRNILQGNSLLSPTDFLGDDRLDVYREWVYALQAQRDLLARYRTAAQGERPALARLIRTNDQRLASDLLARAIDTDEADLQQLALPQRDLFGRTFETNADRCRELQARIAANRRKLEEVEEGTLDFFSFDVHFAHVLSAGGFDVVLGNPPWVRNGRIEPRAKKMYSERFALFRAGSGSAAFHQPDLSLAFVERALSLAASDGIVAMLLPAKIANAGYAAPLRKLVQERLALVAVNDWSDDARRHFDADTFPLGLVLGRAEREGTVRVTAAGESFHIEQQELSASHLASEWSLAPPDVNAILRRLRRQHRPLAVVLEREPVMGVKSGDNVVFFVKGDRIEDGALLTSDGLHIPLEALCRCVRGRDVRRWSAAASQWMLWPPAGGWRQPPDWLRALAALRGVVPETLRLSYVRPEHVGIKVAWKDLARGVAAAVLTDVCNIDGHAVPLIPNQTLYSIDAASVDEAYALSALLNSTVADALLVSIAERAKDSHYRYFGRTVARMPLPAVAAGSVAWERLVRLARRAHHGANVAHELDRVVAAEYGVTDDELARLRAFVDRRLARDAR
ncbi:MAG: hypothetical protein JWO56_3461 [Acidobacteria bacterium]|nr:hypothetical protein [Acidobacteriota bacterium]